MRTAHDRRVRNKALEEIAEWCRERAEFQWADPERAWAYGRVEKHARSLMVEPDGIAANRAHIEVMRGDPGPQR